MTSITSDQFFLEMFKEEHTHARHTETQRLEVTKFILGAVGVLLALMGALKFSIYSLPFGVVIILLGIVGVMVTATYIKRFDVRRSRARAFRREIDLLLAPPGTEEKVLSTRKIGMTH